MFEIDGAVGILRDLQLPEELIDQVRSTLHDQAEQLHGSRPSPFGAGVFGGAPTGHNLEHHAGVAQQHVVEAITEMVQGLQGYADNLRGFAADLRERDYAAAHDLDAHTKRLLERAQGTTTGHDYHDHNQSAPGLGSGEGEG